MKKILLISLFCSVFLVGVGSYYLAGKKCTGSKNCSACKNCKYCQYCAKKGGTCGVCK